MARSNGDIVLRNTQFQNHWCPFGKFAEHWKLVAESSDFHLKLQLEIRKKAGHYKWKVGKQDGAKKREFTPESDDVDTYGLL